MVPLPSYPAAPALPDALSKVHTANPSTVKAACLAAAFSFPGMELLVDVVAAAARDSPEAAVLDIDLRGEGEWLWVCTAAKVAHMVGLALRQGTVNVCETGAAVNGCNKQWGCAILSSRSEVCAHLHAG
jgi:hypothetical protein